MKKLNLFFGFLLGLVLLSSMGFASTYYVNDSTNGCNTTTIDGSAVNLSGIFASYAADGDTIIVCKNGANNYSESGPVTVNVSVNIYGNESGVVLNVGSLILSRVEYVNITNISILGVGNVSGFNTVANGFILIGSNHSNIYNVTVSNVNGTINWSGSDLDLSSSGVYVYNYSHDNSFTSVRAYNVTYGAFVNSMSNHNNTFTSLNFSNSTYGVYLNVSDDNTVSSSYIYDITTSSLYMIGSNRTTLSSNTIYSGATLLTASNSNTLTFSSNTIDDFSTAGVHFTGVSGSTLSSNVFTNVSGYNVYMEPSSHNNTLNLNNFTNASSFGLMIAAEDDLTVTNNRFARFIGDVSYGTLIGGQRITFANNTITNSTNGFYFYDEVLISSFTGNTMSNISTVALMLVNVSDSLFNFTGNNTIANNTLAYVYLSNATLHTGEYMVDTEGLDFALNNSYNISIGIANMVSSSLNTVTNIYTAAGVLIDSTQWNKHTLFTGYALNASNLSATYMFSPTLFYHAQYVSDFGAYTLRVANTSVGTNWTLVIPNSTAASELYVHNFTAISSTMYLLPFAYGTLPISSGTTTTSKKEMSLTYTFDCETGDLVVSGLGDDATVQLIGSYLPNQEEEDGKATFTLTTSGTYTIRATASGYHNAYLNVDLTMCSVSQPQEEVEEVEEVEEQPEEEVEEELEQEEEELEQELTPQELTLSAIEMAQTAINEASSAGKLTAEAEVKLMEAQEAYDQGDYDSAQVLAEEAITLAQNAQAPEQQEDGQQAEELEQEEKAAADLTGLYLVGIVVVILVVVIGGFVLMQQGGKKKR